MYINCLYSFGEFSVCFSAYLKNSFFDLIFPPQIFQLYIESSQKARRAGDGFLEYIFVTILVKEMLLLTFVWRFSRMAWANRFAPILSNLLRNRENKILAMFDKIRLFLQYLELDNKIHNSCSHFCLTSSSPILYVLSEINPTVFNGTYSQG